MNKRGAELAIGTLVIIVIAIVVLVVLILGFTTGWNNLWGKIGLAGSTDLTSFIASCRTAAISEAKSSFCECRTVEIDEDKKKRHCDIPQVTDSIDSAVLSKLGKAGSICTNKC